MSETSYSSKLEKTLQRLRRFRVTRLKSPTLKPRKRHINIPKLIVDNNLKIDSAFSGLVL